MKKISKIVIIFLFMASLTGCTDKVKDLNGNAKNEFGINETAVYKDIYYTVTNTEYTDVVDESTVEDENNTFFAVVFEVKNNSNKVFDINYECILKTEETSSEELNNFWTGGELLESLSVGEKYTRTYYWEISKDDSAQTYWCLVGQNEVEFTFDLTK